MVTVFETGDFSVLNHKSTIAILSIAAIALVIGFAVAKTVYNHNKPTEEVASPKNKTKSPEIQQE